MTSIVTYVRNLLGSWFHEEPPVRPSFKRDRTDDGFSSDEELPAFKRLKQLKKTKFPDVMESNDKWETKDKKSQNVRYVPIRIERGHPSTSTPIDLSERQSRVTTVPVKLVNVSETNLRTPTSCKPRIHTPVRPVIRAVIEDDNDDDEVTLIETKPENSRNPTKIYIEDTDDDNDQEQQQDVVFIKKVLPPKHLKPYKYFVSKNDQHSDHDTNTKDENIQYYSLRRKLNDRNANTSPKTYSKFIAPPGVIKSYKKAPTPVARWMQIPKSSNLLQPRNRVLNINGNARATLSEVFNLDEKRNYQELIRRVAETTKNISIGKPVEIINLAEDSACFRNTQRTQRNALNEIKFLERGLNAEKEIESTTEYDPITVASINSSDSEVEVVPSESSTSSSVKIVPLNTLKDSYRDKPVTAHDWLAKINSKYKKKDQNNKEKIRDASRESDIISKVNYEQRLAHLEHKLKHELSIPESLIEEPQPEEALPQLTEAQEKLIERALGPGPSGQLLVEKFNLRIHRRDLQTLCGLNWLNDEVINFYMNLLMQRSEQRKDLPRVYATNTFFYPKLMQSGQAGLRRWTRKVDIFAHDLLVVPVHLGVHWCLSLVDFRARRVSYLDSMGGRNPACLAALLQYLRDEHQDKKGQPFDDSGWSAECLKDIPQQMNGSDCGMFACTFAEFSCRNAPYTFSQQHMPYLRRKAVLEILQGKLLL